MTNIKRNTDNNKSAALPAGIAHGTEYYAHEPSAPGHTMHEGHRIDTFTYLPREVRRAFFTAFLADEYGRMLIRDTFHTTSRYYTFLHWMHCKFGGMDERSDYDHRTGRLHQDINNHCRHFACPLYGKLCKSPYGLLGYEVVTLIIKSYGYTDRQTAIEATKRGFPVGEAGVKSRIHKMLSITGSTNTIEMVSKVLNLIKYHRAEDHQEAIAIFNAQQAPASSPLNNF